MDSVQESTIAALKSIRSLVGDIAFETALNSLRPPAPVAPALAAPAPVAPKRTRTITDEQRAAAKANMAAMQAFIKERRSALPEGTPFKEAMRQAGEAWKALSKEQKEAWKPKGIQCGGCAQPITDLEAHRPCVEQAIEAAVDSGKSTQEAVKQFLDASGVKVAKITAEPEKRGRGRPPKDGLVATRLNVRRLSKTETDEAPLPGSTE